MRSAASAGLALALLLGFSLTPILGLSQAQEPDVEVGIDTSCHQLVCQFEATNATEAVEGNVTAIEWVFGPNGTTAEGTPVEHTFPSPGTYEVQVTVTGTPANATGNSTGNETPTASTTEQVTVTGREVPWGAVVFGALALAGSIALSRLT